MINDDPYSRYSILCIRTIRFICDLIGPCGHYGHTTVASPISETVIRIGQLAKINGEISCVQTAKCGSICKPFRDEHILNEVKIVFGQEAMVMKFLFASNSVQTRARAFV